MARRGSRRKALYQIVSLLVTVVVIFCVLASWDAKHGGALGLPDWSPDIPSALDGMLDDFAGEQRGGRSPAADGEPAGLEVHFLDVGQAESILIRAPAADVLIDAGENNQGDDVIRYLQDNGVYRLDYVIGTHPHSDHIGGLDTVIAGMEVEGVILPVIPDAVVPTTQTYSDLLDAIADKGLRITPAVPGKRLDLGGGAELLILGPVAEYSDLNNLSVVCQVRYGDTAFLLTGDAEKSAEKDILTSGRSVRADVLGVGHHGSSTSSTEEFLDAVSPRIAVISCGVDNSYGHPHREVIERLEAREIAVMRTDLDGAVVVATDGHELAVTRGK